MSILDYKYEDVKSEGLMRKFRVIVHAEPIAKIVAERLKEAAAEFEMPGFRKGKVPESIVRKQLGPRLIRETIEQEVDKILKTIFEEKSIMPAGQPQVNIDQYEDKKDLAVDVELEVLPPVPQLDLPAVEKELEKKKVKKITITVTKEDISNAEKEIKTNFKTYDSAGDASAQNGDAVVIDFEGKVNGEAFTGNKGENVRLEIGSGQFVPGFEEQLIGTKKGDKPEIKARFPKGYHEKKIAGKEAVFAVEVKDVLKPEAVDNVDDDFAKKLGLESLEKLHEMLEGKLIMDYQSLSRLKLKKDLFDAMDAHNRFDVPESMLKMDFEAMWAQVKGQMQKNPEAFKGKSESDLKKEYKNIAARRVRLGILLSDIARKEGLEVSEEDLQQAIFNEAMQKPGQESLVIEFYSKPENRERLKGPILEEKAVDYIMSKIKIDEEDMTSKEFFEKYADELNQTAPAA